ncbi:hypothetical protein C8T65DRAFT_657289 [Cerioporus squamosus]|nr:hypothetical protein C8T65DRAFT_657289 [Cerioporus squamosus]
MPLRLAAPGSHQIPAKTRRSALPACPAASAECVPSPSGGRDGACLDGPPPGTLKRSCVTSR